MPRTLARACWATLFAAMLALPGCGGGGAAPETVAAKADVSTFKGNGTWWNPSESGTGFFFEAQGAMAVVTYYVYDDGGRPIWYLGAGSFSGDADGKFRFTGTLQRYSGGQAGTSATPRQPTSTAAGSTSIVFDGETAQVQVPGRSWRAEKFNRAGRHQPATATQPRTGAWWSPAEDGRGYTVEVADNRAFVGVFHYAEDGSPTWHLVAIPLGEAGQPAQAEFVAYAGGQTLAGAYKAPTSSAAQGSFSAQFSQPCKGMLSFPRMASIAVERFSFNGLQGCDDAGGGTGGGATAGPITSYEFQPVSLPTEGYRSQAIAMGAKGYRLLAEMNAYGYFLWGKVSDSPITHELHVAEGGLEAQQAQLQALGNRGLRWAGRMGIDRNQLVMEKAPAGATFAYQVRGSISSPELLAEMNQLGADGYLKVQSGGDLRAYQKHVQGTAKYGYEKLPAPADDAALVAQLQAQGARGFRLMRRWGGDNLVYYEKELTQSARFSYVVLPEAATAQELQAQLTAQAAQGHTFLADFYYPDNSPIPSNQRMRRIFYSVADCTGRFCQAHQAHW